MKFCESHQILILDHPIHRLQQICSLHHQKDWSVFHFECGVWIRNKQLFDTMYETIQGDIDCTTQNYIWKKKRSEFSWNKTVTMEQHTVEAKKFATNSLFYSVRISHTLYIFTNCTIWVSCLGTYRHACTINGYLFVAFRLFAMVSAKTEWRRFNEKIVCVCVCV